MKIVFATGNSGKLREASEILGGGFELVTSAQAGITEDIPETGKTLKANSIQKAEYVWDRCGMTCFADDTGLEVDALAHQVYERIALIILLIHLVEFVSLHGVFHHDGAENATGEVASVGDEVDFRIEAVLQLLQGLPDLRDMLVFEGFVDADIVVAPAEVGRGPRLYAGSGAAGYGVYGDVFCEQSHLRGG